MVNTPLTNRLLEIASKVQAKRAESLAANRVVDGQARLLLTLAREDGVTMGTLAATLAISASTATKTVILLEQRGLIRREASRIDSRRHHAFLTEDGRKMAGALAADYAEFDEKITGRLKPKSAAQLGKLLTQLDAAIEGREPTSGKVPRKPKKTIRKAEKRKSAKNSDIKKTRKKKNRK